MATAARQTDSDLPSGLTVDESLAWAKGRPGRFELHDGDVVAMAAERVRHAVLKGAAFRALGDSIARAGSDCRALPGGVSVRVSDRKWYQPEALVYCGPEASGDDLHISNPIIVAEVSSPSTSDIDEQQKLVGYFSLPRHYLVIYSEEPLVHHRRQGDSTILTRMMSSGVLRLDPPGLELNLAAVVASG